jgi:hypothetical protein
MYLTAASSASAEKRKAVCIAVQQASILAACFKDSGNSV